MKIHDAKLKVIFRNLICHKAEKDRVVDYDKVITTDVEGSLIKEKNAWITALEKLGFKKNTTYEKVKSYGEGFKGQVIFTQDSHTLINWDFVLDMIRNFNYELNDKNHYILLSIKYNI